METTLAPAALAEDARPARTSPVPALSLNRLGELPARNKVMLGAAAALLAGVMGLSMLMGREPEWRVLYANMNDRDGGAVLTALTQLNVPYKFTEGSGTLMVPAARVHDVRLRLASQGLPKGGTVGFELMENQKFGVTQFQERLNFQRGLEGELARSIMALQAVQSARVHLALPAQTAFMREQQKPSASVMLTLYGGRTLERNQIAGIVHLVASSVPEMPTRAVSVVDQNGTLLSQAPGEVPNGLDAPQLQYVRQTEQSLATRILSILEPIVGTGNVRAQVTADIDFTQSESTAEVYTPNQGSAPAAVRSQQLSETPGASAAQAAAQQGGVPGALANQPPATPTSPVNGAPGALTAGAGATGAAAGVKRDAVTNYEVDKTVRVVRSATGNIRRLNAAVIVNHATKAGADGKPVTTAIPAAQMEQINALVREAMGFSKERGDSVNVVNAPFTQVVEPKAADLPWWRQPDNLDLARTFAPWLALPLVALIIILGLVRPAMRAARPVPLAQRVLSTSVQDAIALPTPEGLDGKVTITGADPSVPLLPTAQAAAQQARNAQLDNIRQLAKQNPATVANVVRSWVNQPA